MKTKPTYTVDVRNTISPFSLLKVSNVFQQMKPFEIVEVLGCDSEMRKDLSRLLPEAACKVIEVNCGGGLSETPVVQFIKNGSHG
ncbi:MAG: hypothetical protein GY874_07870 [Desulfobacteraceae bacterium]|nr:hypothetical protein [Desulfobacteraceae bacterium]